MFTSYVRILFAQSERGNQEKKWRRRKKYEEKKSETMKSKRIKYPFANSFNFYQNSHARTQKASERKTYAQRREDEKTRQCQYESHVA